eukprot:scaffold139_cov325-Pavlova_lutheri.AAC.22
MATKMCTRVRASRGTKTHGTDRRTLLAVSLLTLARPSIAMAEESTVYGPRGSPGAGLEAATFAGGCFWCMEKPFDHVDGVENTVSGYCGGREARPTYKQVSAGVTGHAESLRVEYDPKIVSYEELLDVFWRQINPTQENQQFCDRGRQYRSAIFYHDEMQKEAALNSREKYEKLGVFQGPIRTEIVPVTDFWDAEEYHQDYYKKNPLLYRFYRSRCGRDQYLDSVWGSGNH